MKSSFLSGPLAALKHVWSQFGHLLITHVFSWNEALNLYLGGRACGEELAQKHILYNMLTEALFPPQERSPGSYDFLNYISASGTRV